jgi:hypothetical protein
LHPHYRSPRLVLSRRGDTIAQLDRGRAASAYRIGSRGRLAVVSSKRQKSVPITGTETLKTGTSPIVPRKAPP